MQKTKASTLDIIGRPRPIKINPKWQTHYQQLVDLREKLTQSRDDLSESAKEELPSFSLHMADAGTDQYDRDFALSMVSSEQSALYEIEQALNRIRDGTYGMCELSGQQIEQERLEAIPWARFSAAAQKDLEDNGAVTRTRLAARESVFSMADSAEDESSDD